MHDIICYDNKKIRIPQGSSLRIVLALIPKNGKIKREIASIKRIPDAENNSATWEILFITKES